MFRLRAICNIHALGILLFSLPIDRYVTCRFKTFGRFETAMVILIPLQGLEMAWPLRNGQLFLLAALIPHQFDISGQVCFVAFKCNSSNTIKLIYLLIYIVINIYQY